MKKIILTLAVLMMGLWSSSLFSQSENEVVALGLPGDNLNLYAVLDIFQNSQTLEEFERKLNSRDTNINNLDLNNDNFVDYISVVSYNLGHFYSIVLRISVNSSEFQDVAVIEVSKNNAGNTIVQIIGDEALYGEDYVVEPSVREAFETPNPGYIGDRTIIVNNNIYGKGIVYVADWPIIAYIFSPSFSLYISPWHWGYYPVYWSPWRPILYFSYWNYHNHYYRSPRYHRTSYIRFPSNHSDYLKRRTTSTIVIRNRNAGTYRSTYGGRTFRKPTAPPSISRRDINRENSESTRRQIQPSTRTQEKSSTRQETRESTRRQVQPSIRTQEKSSTRQENRESTRRQVQPPTRTQEKSSTRQETRESTRRQVQPSIRTQEKSSTSQRVQPSTRQENPNSTRRQVQPSKSQAVPSSARQTERQTRRSARQAAKEERKSNRSESQKMHP
jgi:hypothetical protein